MGLYRTTCRDNAPSNGAFKVVFNGFEIRRGDVFILGQEGCVVERCGEVVFRADRSQNRETNIVWRDTIECDLNGTKVLITYFNPPLDLLLWRDVHGNTVKTPWMYDGAHGVFVFDPPDELKIV